MSDTFSEDIERRSGQLLDCLRGSTVEDIVGLVGALGPSAGKGRGEDLWTYHFTFAAWRRAGGVLEESELTVRKLVTEEELDSLEDRVTPYTVVKIKAHYSDDCSRESGFEDPQALLVEIVDSHAPDADLERLASKLQAPVIVTDELFGELELDRALNWLEGETSWGSEEISVRFSLDECQDQGSLIRSAKALWRDQPGWDRRIRGIAVEKLLPLKNQNWLDEGEEELSPQQFEARIEPESIVFYPDRSFELCFDDGDLFSGHVILVSGSVSGELSDAEIAG